ncbi:MAG: hypothetical protein KO206_07690 [Methanomicrobiaceae archaeon]|nr:hypothetical protein [Methanomicrobiaceae archaeon]MDD5419475.1 hypothetical protein [Methanomicrobiaceae archaeon]
MRITIPTQKVRGGVLATVGFLLSPLSWWNDLIINLPIAYAIGVLFGLLSDDLFLPGMIGGYWFTNILGFILMHIGISDIASGEGRRYTRRDFAKDFFFSLLYTGIILALVYSGILRFPEEFFR